MEDPGVPAVVVAPPEGMTAAADKTNAGEQTTSYPFDTYQTLIPGSA